MSRHDNATAPNGGATAVPQTTESVTDYTLNDGSSLIPNALSALYQPHDIVELRIPKVRAGDETIVVSGYYNDLTRLAADATESSGKAPGIYVTLNPIKPELEPRIANTLDGARKTTADRDILTRRWLPIDLDPIRDSGVSATEAERDAAHARALAIRDYLTAQGWPEPIYADSGNGAHLLYCIDLPNDNASKDLVKRCLERLSYLFSDTTVNVDTSTFNASRIWKLYGTLSAKGENTPERPYRVSRLIAVPKPFIEIVSPDQLNALIAQPEPALPAAGFDIAKWIADQSLSVQSEGAWLDSGYKWVLESCPFDGVDSTEPHGNDAAAMIGRHPSGALFFCCLHDRHREKTWHDLRDLLEPESRERRQRTSPNQATALVNLVKRSGATLWHTPDGEGWITVVVREHHEHYPLDSQEFIDWAKAYYYEQRNAVVSERTVTDARSVLTFEARNHGSEHEVFIRSAEHDGTVYIDLADHERNVVEIAPDGWRVVADAPVRFARLSGTQPLPVPVRGGTIAELRRFVNPGIEDDDFRLFVSWLLHALLPRTFGADPIMVLNGPQGSGKTTTLRVAIQLTDPNEDEDAGLTKNIEDLMVLAIHRHVVSFDNVSKITSDMSDALARLSTGATVTTRKLYTNKGKSSMKAQRPVILNGIPQLAWKSDLRDRAVVVNFPRLRHEDDRAFWRHFETARPTILGALYDALVDVLRDREATAAALAGRLPRMTGFAITGAAAAPALGWTAERFLDAYRQNRADARSDVLEGDPIAKLVSLLMETRYEWVGTATELLEQLNSTAYGKGRGSLTDRLVKLPNQLANRLGYLADDLLEQEGIFMEKMKVGRNRTRLIRLSRSFEDVADGTDD